MYSHAYEDMEEVGVSFKLEIPVWMDDNGNQCAKNHASGCTVTHRLTYQEICFVIDEVGGIMSQKGDRYIRGRY